ncbi:hypothetical protein Btru_050979 [Bulinus truncatus]|nr:hypothetical protein Btru_050979 [Bulinus truncatus]
MEIYISGSGSQFVSDGDIPGSGSQFVNDGDIPGSGSQFVNDGDISGSGSQFVNDGDIPGSGSQFVNDGDISGSGSQFVNDGDIPGSGSHFVNDGDISGSGSQFVNDEDISGSGSQLECDVDIFGLCWGPDEKVVTVTEGQTLFLKCFSDKWFVTYNGQDSLVSDCSTRQCQNFMPDKFLASFDEFVIHWGRRHHRMPTLLQVLSVDRNLTAVQCERDKWTFSFEVKLPKVTLMSDIDDEVIDPSVGSKVTFTCSYDGDVIGPISLYKEEPSNVLNVTLTSNKVTYVMSDFKCGTSFLVGCRAGSDVEIDSIIKVNVRECPTTGIYLAVNGQINNVSVNAGQTVTFACKSDAPPGSLISLYSSDSTDRLAQSKTPNPLTLTLQIPPCSSIPMFYSCQDDRSRTDIWVNVLPDDTNRFIFYTSIDSNDYIEDSDHVDDIYVTEDNIVNFNCMAGSCYTGNMISLQKDGQTLQESVVPDTLYYAVDGLTCGTAFTVRCYMSGRTNINKEILVHTSSCEEHHRLHSTKRAIIGASLGSAGVVILIVAIVTVCCCRRHCLKKGTSTYGENKVPPVYVVDSKDLLYTDFNQKKASECSLAPPEYSTLPPSYNEAVVNYK